MFAAQHIETESGLLFCCFNGYHTVAALPHIRLRVAAVSNLSSDAAANCCSSIVRI